jgi:Zn-dependent peptidase ImmA (M78 family)
MVRLLESRGVAVYSIPQEYADVDAFSFCWRAKPFVMLNTMKTPERSRFDAAHELGHLVLHSEGNQCSESKVLEREANEFASAFLMPELSVRQHFGSPPTTDQVIRSKLKWRVAALALTYRLHELEILSDWNYRQMLLRLGSLGYRTGEPEGINERESSAILRKVLDSLRHDRIPFSKISHDLDIRQNELAKLMFGLAIAPVDGQKHVSQAEHTMKEAPILRVMPGGR